MFLWSYIQEMAMSCWSQHKCEQPLKGDSQESATRKYANAFQREHDLQMEGYIQLALEEAKQEAEKGLTIDDRTEESMQILKSKY